VSALILIDTLERIFLAYIGLGFLYAIYFYKRRLGQLEPASQKGSWGFKWILFPSVLVLWPLIVVKGQSPEQKISRLKSSNHLRQLQSPLFAFSAILALLALFAAVKGRDSIHFQLAPSALQHN